MRKIVDILHNRYIQFLIWLGATPPTGFTPQEVPQIKITFWGIIIFLLACQLLTCLMIFLIWFGTKKLGVEIPPFFLEIFRSGCVLLGLTIMIGSLFIPRTSLAKKYVRDFSTRGFLPLIATVLAGDVLIFSFSDSWISLFELGLINFVGAIAILHRLLIWPPGKNLKL